MTHVTCRLTAKTRDQLRNPTLGNRVWATPFLATNSLLVTCPLQCYLPVCHYHHSFRLFLTVHILPLIHTHTRRPLLHKNLTFYHNIILTFTVRSTDNNDLQHAKMDGLTDHAIMVTTGRILFYA